MSNYQKRNPQRQKLVGQYEESILEKIEVPLSLEEVKERLQEALIVEHFTIPPYLCALYSIKDGTNAESYRVIQTVVIEEMLHMVMVANLINALGGKPEIRGKALLKPFPSHLPIPDSDFNVSLLKFSKEAIKTALHQLCA